MKLVVIEGARFALDGGSMYGHVPKTVWAKWSPPDDLNRIPLAARSLLMQTKGGKNILFETGIGPFFEPKLKERFAIADNRHYLLENLKLAGIEPKDIDAIVLSHLHFDHAGGLLPPYGETPKLVFPKARFYLSKTHWEYALSPHPREKGSFIPLIRELLEASGRVILIEGETHKELPDLRFHYSQGHTVGMMLSELPGPILFASDLVPGMPWLHLPITMGFDRFSELIVDEKKALLERDFNLFFTHDPVNPWSKELSR